MADDYTTIREAILAKHQIVATYRGHVREMCPHALGTKNGKPQALFFQFGGSSSSGLPEGGEWRCMPLDGLSDVSSMPGPWHTDPTTHSQAQTCIDSIDVEVEY